MSIFDDCRTVSCVSAAVALGIKLRRQSGHTAWALCPLHGEKGHPSLFLSDDRGWYCYGCHRGGDAIKLYQEYLGLEPIEAARQCAQDHGIPVDDYDGDPTINITTRHLVSALHRRRDKVRSSLANQICDIDDRIQIMIQSNGMEACANDDSFMALVEKQAQLQTKLDQLTDADDLDLIDILKQYNI